MTPYSLQKAAWIHVLFLLICLLSTPNAGAYLFGAKSRSRQQRHGLSASARGNVVEPLNIADIEKYAEFAGLLLKKEESALSLRLEAYPIENPDVSIGYLTCFIRPFPFGLLQLDTIQIKNRRQTLGFKRKSWTMDGPGISFIMGSWALRWAFNKGCRKAELLAVNDSESMHAILIKLYESFGFTQVRELTEMQESVPDRLVWGAVGTLMKLDLNDFFENWNPRFQVLFEEAERKAVQAQAQAQSVDIQKNIEQ